MDQRRILIDTSILLGYLRRKEKENTILYNLCQSYDEVCVSAVTVFEVFYGSSPEHQAAIRQLFQLFTILPLDADVARLASQEYQRLRAQGQLLEIRELIIGTTAVANDVPLATVNTSPFRHITGIKIVF